ncbi:hypothetical protein [Spirosoma sp. 209]|uniref:hypothetical protein n=1 Tax=Spirosoma sp. 209 TaxID=1955701 RepID=UPI00098D1F0A|nr:hypothetical protein [Spirosoma sp. 209]
MKPILLLFFLFALSVKSTSCAGQGIVFESGSWEDAVKKARKQKKLLFLHVDAPQCGGCTETVNVAFNSPLLREKFALNFISFRVDGTTAVGRELVEKLEIECTPSSAYLDVDENPLARFCGSTTFDRAYLEKAEEAMTRHRTQPMKPLTDAYAKGDRSPALMRNYINRRREIGLSTGDLLDEYIRQLPPDSLQSAALLRFIFEQGPIVSSKPDSVFRARYSRVDSLYRVVGWNKAVELNNRTINNSIRKAIRNKDMTLAVRTAAFVQRTHQNNIKNGMAGREWTMVRYYRGIKDTARFLSAAVRYYDTYFMTARVDSIQNLDNLENQRRMRGTIPPSGGVRPGGSMTSVSSPQSFVLNPNTQRFVGALNNAAWEFYGMTKDPVFLGKALDWSKRSLEFREDPSSMDTYAHLLYRLNRKAEAIDWQEKAVQKSKEFQFPSVTSLEKALQQMKDGTL